MKKEETEGQVVCRSDSLREKERCEVAFFSIERKDKKRYASSLPGKREGDRDSRSILIPSLSIPSISLFIPSISFPLFSALLLLPPPPSQETGMRRLLLSAFLSIETCSLCESRTSRSVSPPLLSLSLFLWFLLLVVSGIEKKTQIDDKHDFFNFGSSYC